MGSLRGELTLPPVRRAGPEDAALCARLNSSVQDWHATAYPDRFLPGHDLEGFTRHFEAELRDPDVTCFLSGVPEAGYVLCRFNDRPTSVFSPAHRRIYIAAIGVLPEARRRGHGRALMAAARRLALENSCHELLLDSWARNTDAHRFFEAEGFSVQRLLYARAPQGNDPA